MFTYLLVFIPIWVPDSNLSCMLRFPGRLPKARTVLGGMSIFHEIDEVGLDIADDIEEHYATTRGV